ncbi:MAG: type II toxin-antitoxin system HicA family toxin [Thermodesulfobacteriota bacterium]
MGRKERLLDKARTSPGNLTFDEICALAESVGFAFRNQAGSHRIYKHPAFGKIMNFQPDKRDKSKAKRYQIRQLLAFIEESEESDV